MSSNVKVYVGPWRDHSQGPITGAKLTLSAAHARLLVAFLAVFVSIVGGISWSFISYVIHQRRATQSKRDGLDYQLNLLLRNNSSPISFLKAVIQCGNGWRHKTARVAYRIVPLAILATCTFVCYTLSGLLASQLASDGDVLLSPNNCAKLAWTTLRQQLSGSEFYELTGSWLTISTSDMRASMAYAQNCYPSSYDPTRATQDLAPASDCDYYPKPYLKYNVSYGVDCPFKDGLCSVPPSDIVQLDTGMIDTHFDLGMNAPIEDRLQLRRVATCSPITTDGFSSGEFENTEAFGLIAQYNYGPSSTQAPFWSNRQASSGSTEYNTTFVYRQASYNARDVPFTILVASTEEAMVGFHQSPPPRSFNASSKLANDDLPITLFMLANRAIYQNAVTDPWFYANSPVSSSTTSELQTESSQQYTATAPGTVLGCTEQSQLCNPAAGLCSSLGSAWLWNGNMTFTSSLRLNEMQQDMAAALFISIINSGMWRTVGALGQASLTASNLLNEQQRDIVSAPLPINQWQLEVQNWFTASLAYVQRAQVLTVAAPLSNAIATPASWSALTNTSSPLAAFATNSFLCSNQKIRSAAYASFSILGLSLVLGFGGLIVIASVTLQSIVPRIQRQLGRSALPRRAWHADGMLQVQGRLFEALGKTSSELPDGGNESILQSQYLATIYARPREKQRFARTLNRSQLASSSPGGAELYNPFEHDPFERGRLHSTSRNVLPSTSSFEHDLYSDRPTTANAGRRQQEREQDYDLARYGSTNSDTLLMRDLSYSRATDHSGSDELSDEENVTNDTMMVHHHDTM